MEKGRAAKYVCEDEKVKSGFDVVVWINGLQLQRHYAESVVNHVKHELQEKKKENDSGEGKGFFVVLDDFHNENHKEWLESVKKLKEVAETRASSGGGVFLVITRSKAVIEFVDQSFDFVHKYRFDRSSHSESRFLFEQIAGTSVSAIKSETEDSLLEMCGGILGAIETMERLEMLLKYYNEFNLSSWCLRQCFAYSFFIFSSQDSVKGEKLVRLWMVEGYLAHSSFSSSPVLEDLGHECIEEFLHRLHVLILKNLGMKVLPGSIGDLKSLRYLDLSRNNFNKLPICIGELLHLQTLQLSHCLKLKELPDDVNYFASLRHLEVDECTNLMHMPFALRKLTWLRSLPHFVTSKRNSVGELIDLNEKQHLEGLTLRWNHDDDDDQDEIMLKQLEPHQNLKRLSIIGYQGNQFPGWLSSLNNLVEISLYKCSKCQSLSTLNHVLVNLEKLTLKSLDSLEFIKDNGSEDLRLKQVQILDCPKLTSWWKNPETHNTTVFTAISELVVEYCPKLVSLPLFPMLDYRLVLESFSMKLLLNTLRHNSTGPDPSLSKLNHLTMINADEKQYQREEKMLKNLTSLSSLDIKNCKALKFIKGWKHLNSLEILHITNCTDIDLPNDEWEGLKNLSNLIIEDMSDLKSLPEGIKHLTNLDNLEIRSCPNLEVVPKEVGEGLNDFTFIVIDDCPKIASLPESLINNFIGLKIGNCPLLEPWNKSRPKLPLQASDIQEEQNLTSPDSNKTSNEIQNVIPSTNSRPQCNYCSTFASLY
ncbi:hypothetical protein JHK82_051324 [Glycine max]|nr:hypothetical protein JHK86_051166 [Glycine max]KAG5092546.1 hypothetical protein JHK82_051324 [Glycine max]